MPTSLSFFTTSSAPTFLSAMSLSASMTLASGPIVQSSPDLLSNSCLIVFIGVSRRTRRKV